MSKETELVLNDIINKTNQIHNEYFNINSEKMVFFVGALLAIISLALVTGNQQQNLWIIILEITLAEFFLVIAYSLFKYYIDTYCGIPHKILYYLVNINNDLIIVKKIIQNNSCNQDILIFYLLKFFMDFEYISLNNKFVKKTLLDACNVTLNSEYSLYKNNVSYFKKIKKHTNYSNY